jgi:hypothetical protein
MKVWKAELNRTRAEFEVLEQHEKPIRVLNEQAEKVLREHLSHPGDKAASIASARIQTIVSLGSSRK